MKLVKENIRNSVSQLAGKGLDLERNIALLLVLSNIFSDAKGCGIQIQLVWSLAHFATICVIFAIGVFR